MGALFGGGPTDGDIERAEEKARLEEVERLRIAEQKIRRRESKETLEGSGLSLATDVVLGTDELTELDDTKRVQREIEVHDRKLTFNPNDMPQFNFAGIRR